MNRRELQSDQPILYVPLLRVLSFPPSDVHCRHSRAARATPSNHTQRYASCNCSELAALLLEYTLVSPEPSTKPFKRRPAAQTESPVYGTAYSGARIVWGDAAVAVRAGVAELATFVCRSSSDMTCSDYASVIALRCQVSHRYYSSVRDGAIR